MRLSLVLLPIILVCVVFYSQQGQAMSLLPKLNKLLNRNGRETQRQNQDVVWGSACSPRLSFVRKHQDTGLSCELTAPVGTKITWYKDGKSQLSSKKQGMDIGPKLSDTMARLKTELMLPCIDVEDKGEYTVIAQTPEQRLFSRNFTVKLSRSSGHHPGKSCGHYEELQYHPYIVVAAAMITAQLGSTVVIPCTVQGKDIDVKWYFENELRAINKVSENDDLIIDSMGLDDVGLYQCEASSSLYDVPADVSFTILSLE
ncbi:unnamed protein product [Meganyctiphanes norvegica]|uniref:Ig-like domain-containing protein n=1 Tax=Meganyctiphanes norvegica TaxID=48144 RepID=A0AAV2RNL1_MEGNR